MKLVRGHGVVDDEVQVDGLRVIEVRHASALVLPTHAHSTAKLGVLLAGGGSERSGLDLESHTPLALFTRRPYRSHETQYHSQGARLLLVELDPGDRRARAAIDPPRLSLATASEFGRLLVRAFGEPRPCRGRLVRDAVNTILRTLDEMPRPRPPAWLDEARELLIANMARPPTLSELGRVVGAHPVHLAQSFRAHWGMTTRHYLRAHRVFHALELIDRGVVLAEAAAAVGFADQSHMTRAIRLERGAPPGALRRQSADVRRVRDVRGAAHDARRVPDARDEPRAGATAARREGRPP
ncbi:transcriptional regulator, AraC family [Myxococcus fulvus]|uniref:AraC family transcriptional regulator n=1 Tax=Myxococcus fulvus TaxID=33 RepID=A0A511TD72_MYXFU|nr:AraC family transcriptional regulator [Myxococcus fulvus]GEN12124.1 AraC family transcriptional regulator [Myxococcus fulvus]SEU36516.1 transcriptional regulator, AraC family [Myxococcus fulvus]